MKKIRINIVLLGICWSCLLLLMACSSTQKAETLALSLAESYLQTTSDEFLIDYFGKATSVCDSRGKFGFSTITDVSSNDLFRFAVLMGDHDALLSNSWYHSSEQMYYIPVSEITDILDSYLEGYVFNPNEVEYAEYNYKNDVFVTRALGFGNPGGSIFLSEKSAVDKDTVRVRLLLTMDEFEIPMSI